ncbi:hypothetical protein CPB86DRAFT_824200 [Serendipita vermifera]|nr:hypothetical protein CPB86DRAFT_824200 [Serendipita vermifera]
MTGILVAIAYRKLRLVGYTGSCKTSFIQHLIERGDLGTDPHEPCTSRIQSYQMKLDGIQDLTIVDTPGLRADRAHDSVLKKQIHEFCREQKRWPAFIYCHNIQSPRYDRTRRDCFEVVQELFSQPDEEGVCGQPVNVAILTTHWDDEGARSFREQMHRHVEFRDKVWAKWIKRGRRFHRTDDTTAAAKDIVRSLLQNETMVRRVREEIEQECKTNYRSYADSVRFLEKVLERRLKGFEFPDQRLEIEAKLRILKSCEVPPKGPWPISSTTLTRFARTLGGQK